MAQRGVVPVRTPALRWSCWWVVSMLLWWGLTATTKVQEAIVGAGAAAIAATAMAVVQRGAGPLVRLPPRWLRPAWRVPIFIARDTGLVFAALVRQLAGRGAPRGSYRHVPLGVPSDPGLAAGQELLLTVGLSVSPNTFVLGVDAEAGDLVVHQLVPTRPSSTADLLRLP
jgi:multisubunit Na+/H+ antiporter MnhE subunit